MLFASCIVAVAPVRKEPNHRSEMVSQLLFGECVIINTIDTDFVYIKALYDGYEGWVQKNQLTQVDEQFYNNNHSLLTAAAINTIWHNNKPMIITAGSFIGCFKNGNVTIGNSIFEFSEDAIVNDSNEEDLFNIIQPYLNAPYLWGGKSLFGIDCSGLVQQVFKMLGIALPRDAYQQVTVGEEVGFIQEAKLGDVAFFDNAEGKIIHTGIMLNNEHIVHASGKVRIDKIDHMGIVNEDTKERTHQLRIIKRFL